MVQKDEYSHINEQTSLFLLSTMLAGLLSSFLSPWMQNNRCWKNSSNLHEHLDAILQTALYAENSLSD